MWHTKMEWLGEVIQAYEPLWETVMGRMVAMFGMEKEIAAFWISEL